MSQPPTLDYQTPPPPRPARQPLGDAIPLFTAFGVKVSLHWSWFLIAFLIYGRRSLYNSVFWNVAEYLSLFAIVLLHEYGHALACKSVGGTADRIVLWPLGGVAFVNPPHRAGAYLWSIVAGPLVNVLLLPLTFYAVWLRMGTGITTELERFLFSVGVTNAVLLIFNLLPIYPLDGGQIFRAILWFMVGAARSLQVAAVTGIVGAVVLGLGMYLWIQSWWSVIIAGFLLFQSLAGLKAARQMLAMQQVPRHDDFACPGCGESPPAGAMWRCESCGQPVDAFVTSAVCPRCGLVNQMTPCIWCGQSFPPAQWYAVRAARSKWAAAADALPGGPGA